MCQGYQTQRAAKVHFAVTILQLRKWKADLWWQKSTLQWKKKKKSLLFFPSSCCKTLYQICSCQRGPGWQSIKSVFQLKMTSLKKKASCFFPFPAANPCTKCLSKETCGDKALSLLCNWRSYHWKKKVCWISLFLLHNLVPNVQQLKRPWMKKRRLVCNCKLFVTEKNKKTFVEVNFATAKLSPTLEAARSRLSLQTKCMFANTYDQIFTWSVAASTKTLKPIITTVNRMGACRIKPVPLGKECFVWISLRHKK